MTWLWVACLAIGDADIFKNQLLNEYFVRRVELLEHTFGVFGRRTRGRELRCCSNKAAARTA